LHCTSALQPTSIGFLKIIKDLCKTFYVEIIFFIVLERPWAVAIAALGHRRLALSTAACRI